MWSCYSFFHIFLENKSPVITLCCILSACSCSCFIKRVRVVTQHCCPQRTVMQRCMHSCLLWNHTLLLLFDLCVCGLLSQVTNTSGTFRLWYIFIQLWHSLTLFEVLNHSCMWQSCIIQCPMIHTCAHFEWTSVCLLQVICIWGTGGATPGKFLMGLRVVTCDTYTLVRPNRVLVVPASNVSLSAWVITPSWD